VLQADSDTVIEIIRRNSVTRRHLQNHLQKFGHVAISAMTFFEIERGLHIRQAAFWPYPYSAPAELARAFR
jgi:hypothetical protein